MPPIQHLVTQDASHAALLPLEEAGRIRDSEAEYTLENSVVCPYCSHTIKTVRIVRMLRTRVNFTSMLPRRGRVATCPDCRKILSAELTIG